MNDLAETKRLTLAAALVLMQTARSLDDVADMYVRLVQRLHNFFAPILMKFIKIDYVSHISTSVFTKSVYWTHSEFLVVFGGPVIAFPAHDSAPGMPLYNLRPAVIAIQAQIWDHCQARNVLMLEPDTEILLFPGVLA